jgi:phosphoribosylamine--glycine ligase
MTIVLCSKGYPGKYKKNLEINNLNKIKLSNFDLIFHAGTKFIDSKIISTGGRILNFTSLGNSYLNIRKKIIANLKKMKLKNSFYRKDIGWKVIKNENN